MLERGVMFMLPSRFYDELLENFESNKGNNCDIYEKDGMYHLEMDLPGFKKNEINVEAHRGTLTISAKKEYKKEEHEGKKFLRHERRFNAVERSFYLGDIDDERVHATYEDGILKISVPTKQEAIKKKINIE